MMGAGAETHSQMLGEKRAQTEDLHQICLSDSSPLELKELGKRRTSVGARGLRTLGEFAPQNQLSRTQ